jgi:surface antigen
VPGRVAFALLACLALSACGGKGMSMGLGLERFAKDPTLVTNSISQSSPSGNEDAVLSDQTMIRNAVSAAAVDSLPPEGLAWANADTGSRGAIQALQEFREGPELCRRFVASRESFEGVHLFRGQACLGVSRTWAMRAFDPIR